MPVSDMQPTSTIEHGDVWGDDGKLWLYQLNAL